MNHRHLLPNEIDLLVDGEAGFGIAALRAHLAECPDCGRQYDDGRRLADALETLPHLAPDSRLANRVMAQVPVFVPAHVAARDSVVRWMPRSSAGRAAVAVFATALAGGLTAGLLWLALRGDAVLFVSGLLGDRLRAAVVTAAHDLAVALLGEQALAAVQGSGATGAALLALGFVLAAVGTFAGLRRIATVSARRG